MFLSTQRCYELTALVNTDFNYIFFHTFKVNVTPLLRSTEESHTDPSFLDELSL